MKIYTTAFTNIFVYGLSNTKAERQKGATENN